MLKVVAGSLKVGEAEERSLGHLLRGRGHNGVLDCPTATKHPHQIDEVVWGHSLIEGNTKLGGGGKS